MHVYIFPKYLADLHVTSYSNVFKVNCTVYFFKGQYIYIKLAFTLCLHYLEKYTIKPGKSWCKLTFKL